MISIKLLTGETLACEADWETTVGALLTDISTRLNVNMNQIHLIACGRRLTDHAALLFRDLEAHRLACLHVVIKPLQNEA